MLTLERQNEILEYLKQNKTATVRDLATRLYVSDATIRRDLAEMEMLGLLRRSHGGGGHRLYPRGFSALSPHQHRAVVALRTRGDHQGFPTG